MARCKPGIMAMVVKANFPETEGAIGTVKRQMPGYTTTVWEMEFPHPVKGLREEAAAYDTVCVAADVNLLPITGDPLQNDTETVKDLFAPGPAPSPASTPAPASAPTPQQPA